MTTKAFNEGKKLVQTTLHHEWTAHRRLWLATIVLFYVLAVVFGYTNRESAGLVPGIIHEVTLVTMVLAAAFVFALHLLSKNLEKILPQLDPSARNDIRNGFNSGLRPWRLGAMSVVLIGVVILMLL